MTRRFTTIVLAASMIVATTSVAAFACDKSKNATAARATKAAVAQTASADKGACSYSKNTTAVAASAAKGACTYDKTTAAVANAADHCATSKTSAVTAGTEHGNGKVIAVLTGSSCSNGAKSTAMASKTGCAICDEYASCDEKLTIAGASTQVVPLKNGVMFVYTSEAENRAHAVQAAVHRRNDRIAEIASTGGAEVALCDGCKAMRGAMASGKLHREVVNIEGGSLTLVTSEDATVVRALQEYSGVKAIKS
jgi:hypothetical protein